MEIRPFTGEESETYHAIRKRAVREEPEAFYTSAAEEERQKLDEIRDRLEKPDAATFGAFDGDQVVGMVGFWRDRHEKGRHKAYIWGMYVAPEARRRGTGRKLMEAALERIRALGGVEQVQLGVAVRNKAARKLYRSMGFEVYGVEPNAFIADGRYVNEELMIYRLPRRAGH